MSTILILQKRFDDLKSEARLDSEFNQHLARALISQNKGDKKALLNLACQYSRLNDYPRFKAVVDRMEDPSLRKWASLEGVKMVEASLKVRKPLLYRSTP